MFLLAVTAVLSALLCGIYLRIARRWQILDVPNARSSHETPTPKGGGLPLMLAFFAGVALLFGASIFWSSPYAALLAGAAFLTLLGVADDSLNLSVSLRFFAYGFCCVLLAAALLRGGQYQGILPLWPAILVTAFGMLWVSNLFNFMDGVDGLAAVQCATACGGAALLAGGEGQYASVCLLLGVSHLGFLLWNWPGARLFMGDSGSIPTGFLLAGLAVLGALEGELPLACLLVLLAVFITDASWTLVGRIISAQPFTQGHRQHAYQRLARHWGSHRRVVILLLVILGAWLMPLAWAIAAWPQYGVGLVIVAYLPLLGGMARLRALT